MHVPNYSDPILNVKKTHTFLDIQESCLQFVDKMEPEVLNRKTVEHSEPKSVFSNHTV